MYSSFPIDPEMSDHIVRERLKFARAALLARWPQLTEAQIDYVLRQPPQYIDSIAAAMLKPAPEPIEIRIPKKDANSHHFFLNSATSQEKIDEESKIVAEQVSRVFPKTPAEFWGVVRNAFLCGAQFGSKQYALWLERPAGDEPDTDSPYRAIQGTGAAPHDPDHCACANCGTYDNPLQFGYAQTGTGNEFIPDDPETTFVECEPYIDDHGRERRYRLVQVQKPEPYIGLDGGVK